MGEAGCRSAVRVVWRDESKITLAKYGSVTVRDYASLIPGTVLTLLAGAWLAWELWLAWISDIPVIPTAIPLLLGIPGLFFLYVGNMVRGWRCGLVLSGVGCIILAVFALTI